MIIPVVDIRDGQAVQANGSFLRSQYSPLRSKLTHSADPVDVVRSLSCYAASKIIYIADLNTIMRTGNNRVVLERLVSSFPKTEFWLDAGYLNLTAAQNDLIPMTKVIGSESLESTKTLLHPSDVDWVLSLDFRHGNFLGDPSLLSLPSIWPKRVIILELSAIGREQGPNLTLLNTINQLSPADTKRHFFIGGGVKNMNSIEDCVRSGAKGVLVSSALHKGDITSNTIKNPLL